MISLIFCNPQFGNEITPAFTKVLREKNGIRVGFIILKKPIAPAN